MQKFEKVFYYHYLGYKNTSVLYKSPTFAILFISPGISVEITGLFGSIEPVILKVSVNNVTFIRV